MKYREIVHVTFIACLLLLIKLPLFADSSNYVPPELASWVDWVKQRHPEYNCAALDSGFECVWPSSLQLDTQSDPAKFSLEIELLNQSQVRLPGSGENLPHNIKIENLLDPQARVEYSLSKRDQYIYAGLKKGRYRISGQFKWSTKPAGIALDPQVAIVKDTNANFLREAEIVNFTNTQDALEKKAISLEIKRKISDGSPLELETLIELQISGATRVLELGQVLPDNSFPKSVSAQLPLQINSNGELSILAKAGQHQVKIESVLQQPVDKISIRKTEKNSLLPKNELWAWIPNNILRVVEVSGGSPTSNELVSLPPEWQAAALYQVELERGLDFKLIQRGQDRKKEDSINLEREWWLDLDGKSFTVLDKFSGQLNKDFRIDATTDLKLDRAEVSGQPAFISKSDIGLIGLELRDQELVAQAVSRLDVNKSYSAVGWQKTLNNLAIKLNLAPGWKLLHVSDGVNNSSWVSSWTLLQIFILFITVIATYKLISLIAAISIGSFMIISHAEYLQPKILFLHLLLALVLSIIDLGSNQKVKDFVKVYLFITFSAWTLQAMAFAKLQFTQALFPQLESGTRYRTFLQQLINIFEQDFTIWPVILVALIASGYIFKYIVSSANLVSFISRSLIGGIACIVLLSLLGGIVSSRFVASRGVYYDKLDQPAQSKFKQRYSSYTEEAVALEAEVRQESISKNIRTGSALPTWRWKSYQINFSGPIDSARLFSIYLLPPSITRLFCLVRIVLLFVIFASLLKKLGLLKRISVASQLSIVLMAFMQLPTSEARADMPSPELLNELEKRINTELCREKYCSLIEEMKLEIDKNSLKINLLAQSNAVSAIQLPGPFEQAQLDAVTIDDQTSAALRRDASGFIWVKLAPGRHKIEALVTLPTEDLITLQVLQQPLISQAFSNDWQVEGISSSGTIKESIKLLRKSRHNDANNNILQQKKLADYFHVQRQLHLADNFKITTNVRRVSNTKDVAILKLNLLEQEQVISADVSTDKGQAIVRFSEDLDQVSFQSRLPNLEKISMTSRTANNISEEWYVSCASYYSCRFSGALENQSVTDGKLKHLWYPFNGDTITIEVSSLEAISGNSLTIDSVEHNIRYSGNNIGADLKAEIRSSEQKLLSIHLEPQAELGNISLNNVQSGTYNKVDNSVSLLIAPGNHLLDLNYSIKHKAGFRIKTPQIRFSEALNNLKLKVQPADERWILWVSGPLWGPAVLYWSKLLIVAIFAIIAAHLGLLPLSRISAAILALGLAYLPIVYLLIPFIWLACLKHYQLFLGILEKHKPVIRIMIIACFSLIVMSLLFDAVRGGLLMKPPMLIVGNSSNSSSLNWYIDRLEHQVTSAEIYSLPIWYYRLLMLLWSSWLSIKVIQWLKELLNVSKIMSR